MRGKILALLAIFLALPLAADVVVIGPGGPGVTPGSAYKTKALTAGSATGVFQIPIAAARGTGGKVFYTVFASDATDHQIRTGSVTFAVVNKAATETCTVNGIDGSFTVNPDQTQDGSAAGAISSGILIYAWTTVTTPANACNLALNAVSSLTETILEVRWTVILTGPGTVNTL